MFASISMTWIDFNLLSCNSILLSLINLPTMHQMQFFALAAAVNIINGWLPIYINNDCKSMLNSNHYQYRSYSYLYPFLQNYRQSVKYEWGLISDWGPILLPWNVKSKCHVDISKISCNVKYACLPKHVIVRYKCQVWM